MSIVTILQLLGLIASSFFVAFVVLFALGWADRRRTIVSQKTIQSRDDSIVFMFDDESLVNATPRAWSLVAAKAGGCSDWMRLTTVLMPYFPDLNDVISKLAERGTLTLKAAIGSAQLKAQWKNGLARISLLNFSDTESEIVLDQPSFDAMQSELETLRSTATTAPFLVWRQQADGTIVWANKSYIDLAESSSPEGSISSWPPRHLFNFENTNPDPSNLSSNRVSITIEGEVEPRWFECFETPLGDDSLFTAVTADKVVKAETALNEFVQTLTKTFAHLKVGLAIFDKQRRLALFNPALVDLTSLRVEFLTGRPMLQAVLGQLREKKMLPEPKDYKSWRRQIYELEVAAVNGTYEETWSLANGRTYRVTGRPHPDGALAFLIEDISAEISLTRRFRAELENGQAVLDSFKEAIAVFSPTGTLTLSNAAYDRLWGVESGGFLDSIDILHASKVWSDKCAPSPVWGDAREFVGTIGDRAEWTADVRLQDGRGLACRFSPIAGGATLIGFSVDKADAPTTEHFEPPPQLTVESNPASA